MRRVSGGITAPLGFRANALNCGIKDKKLDLALIYSEKPCVAYGMFTTNSLPAAPIGVSKVCLKDNQAQAIIVNSGCANAATGIKGIEVAKRLSAFVAKSLKIKKSDILLASTGLIGIQLPLGKIKKALPKLIKGLSREKGDLASLAILTTDTHPKQIAVRLKLGNRPVTIGAMAKGAGMIFPHLATMLCFITSNVAISAKLLRLALKRAVDKSFNCINVDGCMSTNDTVFILANGLANNLPFNRESKDFSRFCSALEHVCLELAKMIVRDAEGATKFIKINVDGAKNHNQAKKVAFTIANSNLLKSAMFGEDKNTGRVWQAIGQAGIHIKERDVKISFSSLRKRFINIDVNLNLGSSSSYVYTSDLTPQYVKINAHYT